MGHEPKIRFISSAITLILLTATVPAFSPAISVSAENSPSFENLLTLPDNSGGADNLPHWDGNLANPSENSLIGYWNLDEGQGNVANDGSGLGNDGEVSGAAWTEGMIENALQFDGVDDTVTIPNNSTLNPSRISVAAWLYPTEFPAGGQANDHFLGKYEGGGYQYIAYMAAGGDGEVRFQVMDTTGYYLNESGSTARIPINQWSHFVATWDGYNIKIYINGVEGILTNGQRAILDNLIAEIEATVATVYLEIEAEDGEVEIELEGYLSDGGCAMLADLVDSLKLGGMEVGIEIKNSTPASRKLTPESGQGFK